MRRRTFLGGLATASVAATAGCGALRSGSAITDPTVRTDAPSRRSLHFVEDGDEVASWGFMGRNRAGLLDVSTELSHREGTTLESMALRVWMPGSDADSAAEVALKSPVEGDSSPPPAVSLYTPDREVGTAIEITDLDDLADETVDTVEFFVSPRGDMGRTVAVDATIELASGGFTGTDYTLKGRLDLEFPDLGDR